VFAADADILRLHPNWQSSRAGRAGRVRARRAAIPAPRRSALAAADAFASPRELRARYQLGRARRAWSRGERGRALRAALAAARAEPALVGAAAGAWLARAVR
jgi:hypothetical protein